MNDNNYKPAARKSIIISITIYFILILFAYLYQNTNNISKNTYSTDEKIKLYIEKYAPMAVNEAKRGKVPASITLSQAILESKYGESQLAYKANNHFGIKVGGIDWKGGRYCVYTNEFNKKFNKMEKKIGCFRSYDSAEEGFAHHSDFLINRPRYSGLFLLAIDDYKGWANGLQSAGYATDPKYAEKLINLIERFELHKYDN